MKSEIKNCQNCQNDFTIEPDDFGFYEKMRVPPPTWCPSCRGMRRLTWRNERSLYHNVCAMTGKKIISMFDPASNLVVYDKDVWWSDVWDATFYGQEYDFSKSFFEQFQELLMRVPLASIGNTNVVNSPYGNHNEDCKNCYLTYASYSCENVAYSRGLVDSRDSLDSYVSFKLEKCCEDIVCGGLYKTHFSYDSDNCIDSIFLTSCYNLQNCLGCVNLRNKSHCIFNTQYSKDEYDRRLTEYKLGSYTNLISFNEAYRKFVLSQPRRHANILKSTLVTGDNIMNSKDSRMIFDAFGDVENSKYVVHTLNLRDGYDGYGMGVNGEFLYEGVDFGVKGAFNSFGVLNHGCNQTNYTYMCFNSNSLFGCIGLRKQQYCILNKKYSKEEYEKLVSKIIEQMERMPYMDQAGRSYAYGEFFPAEISPFYYNETIAQEYYPLLKEQAEKYVFGWKDKFNKNYTIDIPSSDIPDNIKDVPDSIIEKVIECAHRGLCEDQCSEGFKIKKDDLQFYRKMNLPIPRLCPNCRHFQRLIKRNPIKLWHRTCMCDKQHNNHQGHCKVEFETSYALDRPEIVYCEKCYQQEVY